MVKIASRNILAFFVLVSVVYVFAPLISTYIFDVPYDYLAIYLFESSLLVLFIMAAFLCSKHFVYLDVPQIKLIRTILMGWLLLGLLLGCLITIYGSVQAALFASYIMRTGVEIPGTIKYIFYPVLTSATVYVSIGTSIMIIRKNELVPAHFIIILIFIAILAVFAISGNRNLILWSISTPVAIFIGRSKLVTILILTSVMIFASYIMAIARNIGAENIARFSMPVFEAWNPMGQEFSTTYRIFRVLDSEDMQINGYELPFSSYVLGIVNFLPSFAKPDDYKSFSNAISSQLGEHGEGLGNSPVGEVSYNGIFPAILIQILPFILVLKFIWNNPFSRKYVNMDNLLKMALLGSLVIMSFNFWRIGFAELVKIVLSYIVAYLIIGSIAYTKRY
ncbi:MAG: hypothetical protein KBD37_05125 [Burkholderiales bacterium]|nr:hypothetical protein [Burkholderiales bacterium]